MKSYSYWASRCCLLLLAILLASSLAFPINNKATAEGLTDASNSTSETTSNTPDTTAGTEERPATSGESPAAKIVEFPVAFNRATKDDLSCITADGKGTIMVTSWNYLNITHDYGKTWEARKLPISYLAPVNYNGGLFYLTLGFNTEATNYYSKDGKQWTALTLTGAQNEILAIRSVEIVNGKRILLASVPEGKTYLFTSSDGIAWTRQSELPVEGQVFWNGKRYTFVGGGYMFMGKPKERNQFYVYPRGDNSAEMIVYGSTDLIHWTLHSGTVKKNLRYTFTLNGAPRNNYYVSEEQPLADGVLRLMDQYANQLTSTDGLNFKMTKPVQAMQSNYYRSPIYKKNNKYFAFKHYWYSSGVIHSQLVTSSDKVHWTTTEIKTALNSMYIIQSGDRFIGYNYDGQVALSTDGLKWNRIK